MFFFYDLDKFTEVLKITEVSSSLNTDYHMPGPVRSVDIRIFMAQGDWI